MGFTEGRDAISALITSAMAYLLAGLGPGVGTFGFFGGFGGAGGFGGVGTLVAMVMTPD
jgi:hypothetical protein